MVQAAPATLTLVRRRTQPTAAVVARLTLTAALAYLAALPLPLSPRPVLAPLTALLVVQATMFQTMRSALQRVVSVVAGVLVAVAFSVVAGFTWWSLTIVIALGLALGYALHLGDHILEVPVSAMLILSLDTSAAATGRIGETLVGAGAGMLGGLVFAPPRVQAAEEAIEDLSRQLASLLDGIAGDLESGSSAGAAGQRLAQARALGGEIRHVDRALTEAEESLRLNPRGRPLAQVGPALRDALEILEHAATTARGVARSVADESQLDSGTIGDAEIRECLSSTLRQQAEAVRTFGRVVRAETAVGATAEATRRQLGADLDQQLAAARRCQDKLADRLRAEPVAEPSSWTLRGELLTHLNRLSSELEAGHRARAGLQRPHRDASWSRRLRRTRRRPRRPPRR